VAKWLAGETADVIIPKQKSSWFGR
jgi:hypothetical protein